MNELSRRGFLGAMLAAAAAPAIVKASSLMPISAPKLLLPDSVWGVALPKGDVTIEGWAAPGLLEGGWHHHAIVRDSTGIKCYMDGERVYSFREASNALSALSGTPSGSLGRYIDGLRISKIARPVGTFSKLHQGPL